MTNIGAHASEYGLENHGINNIRTVYWNLSTPALFEESVKRGEGIVAHRGPLVVRTGQHTGRSPNDKFIVREPSSEDKIWWGAVNRPIDQANFASLRQRMLDYLQGKDLFVQDCHVGADPAYQIPIRIITEYAWHSMFAHNMFIRERDPEKLRKHVPQFTVISAPGFQAAPEHDGTNSPTFIIVNFGRREILIGRSSYAGEIKKSIFTILNYLLPLQGVLSMHCSANVGRSGDVALFFGLSGTGKTSLSADPERKLVGDDEHGWSDEGIFNFEGGCYAKVIRLSPEAEPQIYETTRMFATILENVVVDPDTRRIDLDDDSITENTRASYPLYCIPNAILDGRAGHPRNIVMLTADAFGIMPPIARLTAEQAMYHFLSGYTAKLAGTERGITEPQATFSTCFGAPFMALHPTVYAGLLGEKIARHGVQCWLVNTGWTGGPYGVGHRIGIAHTRAMVHAALSGVLADVPTEPDLTFGFHVPVACGNSVPPEILKPRNTWPDGDTYDARAKELAIRFANNFKQFAGKTPEKVRLAGPAV
jgi:phosphoenolpyruvate carboxykinase (ATP)